MSLSSSLAPTPTLGNQWFNFCPYCCCCPVAQLCPTHCDPMDSSILGFPVLHSLPEFAQTHVQWVDDAILNHLILFTPFSSCPQSFPASVSFLMSQLFASASVLPMNIQGWFPLWLTGLISLLSKGLSRVFSRTTVWKHQFFGGQLSLWSNSHIRIWLL